MFSQRRMCVVESLIGLLLLALFANGACSTVYCQEKRANGGYKIGVAAVDVTPAFPVRLNGFGFRREESSEVRQKIWAKALAIQYEKSAPVVLIAVDNLGVPDDLVQEVAQRLERAAKLPPQNLAVTATHTHTAPMLSGVAPAIFSTPIPPKHQEHIDQYTYRFKEKLEQVALKALKNLAPATVHFGIGKVDFAVNRRTKGGPVDHDLLVLAVKDTTGKVKAIYVNYACHCVTLSDNKVSGDWAGYAQEILERAYPGAIALVSIGCGADANPRSGVTRDKADVAVGQGTEIAGEVNRLLKEGQLRPIEGPINVRYQRIMLPLDTLPSKAEWEKKAKLKNPAGYQARINLERLAQGKKLPNAISYPIQTWTFGDNLAMVFLPGEVVVDYALRLKRELNPRKLWINAYSNASPCYIPSERVLREGGYEGGDSMVYYDLPAKLKPGVEDRIIKEVHRQIGERFANRQGVRQIPESKPLSPEASLAAMRTHDNMKVELVTAEPLLQDPVAIAFGPDGKLWICEMHDYPAGLDDKYSPGGRIRVLESSKRNGKYDRSTIFLDGIPFPTGVTVWRKGVLICAAPDILYAEDTNGDGKADLVRKLFSGFGTENFQGRVNSLEYGLDGWVYGSCGLFGGTIKSFNGKTLQLGDRDFRCKPDTGEIEPATGRTQQGRVRDDWGNWFGCDNSNLCWHYPLADHYLARNPHLLTPSAAVLVRRGPDANKLYPITDRLQLFKLSGLPGRTTAACGLGIYRDELLGDEFKGNAFVCEPVNLLVHRLQLSPHASTFVGRRAQSEGQSEFLASTDGWFRPVQVCTGPDGGLYIVDMYRYVIEHPRWIPQEFLKDLDLRAGATMGRIYRVSLKGKALRQVPRLDQMTADELVQALDSPNGWQRDMASQLLLWGQHRAAGPKLADLMATCKRPEARLHALCVLDGLGLVTVEQIHRGLADNHPGVRRHAARIAERFLRENPKLLQRVIELTHDDDAQVRLQAAFSLGQLDDLRSQAALAALLKSSANDEYLCTAVLSGIRGKHIEDVVNFLFNEHQKAPPQNVLLTVVRMVATSGDLKLIQAAIGKLLPSKNDQVVAWRSAALSTLLEQLAMDGFSLAQLDDTVLVGQLRSLFDNARKSVADSGTADPKRIHGLQFLGFDPKQRDVDRTLVLSLLTAQNSPTVQAAAVRALPRMMDEHLARDLGRHWPQLSPATQELVFQLLLRRNAWIVALLDSFGDAKLQGNQLSAASRQRLLTHTDEKVRRLAAKVLEGTIDPNRQGVIDAFQSALELPADAKRGLAVFTKTCASCHRLDDVGNAIGPDLSTSANKPAAYFLIEMFDPNRNLDSRFVNYIAQSRAGHVFSGVLTAESAASITLTSPDGKQQTLPRKELDSLVSTGKSLMPEGLEKDLTKQQVADLIAFLTQQRLSRKVYEGNRPQVITMQNGKYKLSATNCEIYGDEIRYEAQHKNIGYWHHVNDHVRWSVDVRELSELDVYMTWSCASPSGANAFVLEGSAPLLERDVENTGGWDRYQRKHIGKIVLAPGLQPIILRPRGPIVRDALMDLQSIELIPRPAKQKSGKSVQR